MGDSRDNTRALEGVGSRATPTSAHRWLRPRYSAERHFHAATSNGSSYVTACAGRWPMSDVTDELVQVGTGSGTYATERCPACLRVVEGEG